MSTVHRLILAHCCLVAHNSFARSDPFEHARDPDDDREKEDAYHFITYIPIEGELYELDGLKRTPVSHGSLPKDAPWTDAAKAVIERRIASYGGSEINFNLMAICADQVRLLQRQIESIQAIQGSAAGGDTNTNLAEDKQNELYGLQVRLQEEMAKRERWAVGSFHCRTVLVEIRQLTPYSDTVREYVASA